MDTPLDLKNPPKYCPACAANDLKKKVKPYNDDGKVDYMCMNGSCPWPFNLRNVKKKKKKHKRSRDDSEEPGPSMPPISPEHKKQKLSESNEAGPSGLQSNSIRNDNTVELPRKPQPPSPPSTSTDIEVAGFMTPVEPVSLHADLALSCTPRPTDTASSDKSDDKEPDLKIDSTVSFLGSLPTRQQEMSPAPADVSTPKPLPRTLSSSQVPDESNKALAVSECSPIIKLDSAASSKMLAQCSPGHILDTSSPSYNIPSPGSAFNLVSPKHRRMSMEDGKSPRLIEDAKSPNSDIELKSRETSKRRLSSSGDSLKKAKKATALSEPLTLEDELLDYEPEGVISVESQSEEDSPKKPTAQTKNTSEIQVTNTSSLPGPSGTQPGVASQLDSDPNFTVMPTKIRPPLRLPKHASQMLSSRSSREPSPDMQPPEVFEGFNEGNESEEDIMADADDSDSELESLASECSTMSTISDAGSVDSLNGYGKKKRRGKKKKRKDRRKVHQLKCTKTTGVRPSDLSFKDLAQLDNLGTEVEKLQPFSESSNKLNSVHITSPNNEAAKLREQAISTEDNTADEEMSIQPPAVEEVMEIETVSTVKLSPDYPMQSSEKEDIVAMESSRVDISPDVEEVENASPDYMDNENSIKLFGKGGSVPSPLSPMSTDDQSDDTLRISHKKGSTRGKKNILLPKFRTPVETVKRVGLKVILPVGREESVKKYDVKSNEDKREGSFVTEDSDLVKAETSKTKSVESLEILAQTEDEDGEELSFESELQKSQPLVSKEKDVFKSPKPANHSTAPNAHVFLSPAHSMPSPHYSSLPSPSHPHSLPSPGHFSTPSLLSPMPPTPKSDNEEDTASLPLKLLLKRNSHNENSDWTSSSKSADKSAGSEQGKMSGKSRKGNLDKVVLNLQKSVGGQWQKTLPKDDMESESKGNEEPIPPIVIKTSRRGRKNKEIKKIDELQKPEVTQNAENEKENESGITLPYNNNDENNHSSIKAPAKRGRPPKNKDSFIPSQARPSSSPSVSPPECHKQVVAADGKRRIKLTPCNPPQSLFAISPARSPRFPPPLSPASLPPSPIVSGGTAVASLKSVRPIKASADEEKIPSRPCSTLTKSMKGKNDVDDDELLANVEKALAVQNAKNNLNADSSFDTSQDKSDDSSSSQDKKEPIRTFSRPKKQVVKEGVAHPTISNWLSMTAGIGIEAKLVDDNTINIPPQLDWMSKPAADPEDATVTKVGAGLSSDYAFLNQFMFHIDADDHKKGDVILHVSRGDKSSISLPRQEDRTQVKQHNDTQIDLTADSDEIDVHSLRLVSADIEAFPGASALRSRGKNKASSQPDVVQQEAVQVAHNLIKANNPEHRTTTFGEDWFQWEDWRIDAKFMEIFYEQINRMMQHDMSTKVKTPIIPGLNPIIQMLYSKKRDKSYSKLDIDKMIRFFTTVGVKYWYAVNTCKISQKDAIDTLKRDPYKSNPDYITFLKERKIEELRGNSQTNTSEPHEVGQLMSRQQPLNEPAQLKQVLASQQPVPPSKLKGPGPLKSSAPPEVIQMARGSGLNPPLAHQSGHTTLIQLTRTSEGESSNAPPRAHSGGLSASPKGELTITKKTTVQVAPGLVPPASPAGPINLSRKIVVDEKGLKKMIHSQGRPIQSFASPVRMYASTGSPAQPIYHELQVVRDGGKDGRAVIARQAATGLKSPAVAASPRYIVASSPRYENPLTPSVDSPAPLSVQTSNPPSVQPMSIKQEADQIQQTPVNPDSVAVTSYLDNSVCSVQMIPSVNPDVRNSKGRIGNGNKCVQFFYEKGMTDSPAFPPVYVNTVDEVRAVAAFVAEKAGDFKRRGGGNRGQIPQYYTEAAKARYVLDQSVIKHIEKCFTKKGMKDFKIGAKKRNYPKRSTIIKVGPEGRSDDHTGDSIIKVERIDNEESETAEDLEYRSMGPPNDANHMQEIESIVFGNRMPKAKPRKFNSEKTTTGDTGKGSKRGGKNKLDYKNPSSPMMMGVVSDLLQRSKSIEIQRTDHDEERIQEEAVDDVEAEDEDELNANKPLKVSTSFLRKKRSIGSAVQSQVKNKSKSAKTDSDGEEMDNVLAGSGESVRDSPIDAEKDSDQFREETAKNRGDNVDIHREKNTEKVQNEKTNNVKDGASDIDSIIVESTSCVTKPSCEDSMSERERLQQNCMIGGNMVAVAPEVLAEVNDSKEGLDKIVETIASKVSNEASQGVRKSYRKKHPNKTWKESNEDVFNEKEKEVAEMVRSVSRGSRPSSQASLPDSRPSSRTEDLSRPSSQNDASPSRRPSQARRLFGEYIGHTEEPHPDSPVLGTRHRRIKEDAAKATAAAEANKPDLEPTKPATAKEPQVHFNIKAPKFETSFVRESKISKVKYLLEKKEKKEKKKSKYRGFGETSDPPKAEKPKVVKVKKVKKSKVEDPVSEVVKRKHEKLTLEEKNLMDELMNCASSEVPSSSGSLNPKSQTKEISKNIVEFEEQQTLSNDNAIREDFLEFI